MKVCDCSEECGKSELDLFTVPPTQIAIEEGVWDNIKPHPNYGQGTITFDIPGDSFHYIDLSETELWVEVCIQNKNPTTGVITNVNFGENDNNSKIAPINNFLHSLFSQIQISLNNKEVENSNSNYSYRAYLENLLSYNREDKETFLKSELFIKDEANQIGNAKCFKVNDQDNEEFNKAVNKRRSLFRNQPVQLKGRLHCDLFNLNRYLLSNVNVQIKLIRNKPEFYLIGESSNCFATIIDCFLRVRRAKISPSIMLNHVSELEKTNAKYPLTRVVMKNFTLPYSATKTTIAGVNTGILPKRVLVGFLHTNEYDGTLASNPYNFRNLNITNLVLKVSSKAMPYSSGLQFNYAQNRYLEGYNTLFQGIRGGCGNDISYEEYKNGYCLYAFDLSPDLCSSEHFNLVRDGSLDLEIDFSTALTVSITVLFYMEFENVIEITKQRNVITDYQV